MSNYSSSSQSKVTIDAIIAKSKIKLLSITNASTVKNTVVNTNFQYPAFVPPKGKDISDKEMNESLCNVVKKSVFGSAMLKVVRPTVSLKIPGSTLKTWRLTLPDFRHKPETVMYEKLMGAGLHRYAVPTELLYRSNGTKKALLKRMSTKLIADAPVSPIIIDNLVLLDNHKFEARLTSASEILQSLNEHANAGLPYAFFHSNGQLPKVTDLTFLPDIYHTTGDTKTTLLTEPQPIIQHALNVAIQMFEKIIDSSSTFDELRANIDAFFAVHPELNTFIIKRKDEKVERDEWNEKVRPYGSQALPTRLLSMWAVKPLEDNLANFIQNDKSISAYHYSPYYGGCNHIINYFTKKYNDKRIVFSGLAYGDDQLWQVRFQNGSRVLLAPDVSAMDMSTSNRCINNIVKFVAQNQKWPQNNLFALAFSLTIAFRHDFHIGGPYILSKLHSLISGIPGTTIINIINSACIQVIINDSFKDVPDINENNFFTLLAQALRKVKTSLGYTFKGFETLEFDVAQKAKSHEQFEIFCGKYKDIVTFLPKDKDLGEGINLPFLSHHIVPYTMQGITRLVSLPKDITKLGSTLVLPDDFSTDSKNRTIKTLERISGAYVSGGWSDPEFSEFLADNYKSLAKGLSVVPNFSEISALGELDVLEILQYMVRSELPSREFMFDFCSMDKETFRLKYKTEPSLVYADNLDVYVKEDTSKNEVPSNSRSDLDRNDYLELDAAITFDETKIVKVKKMGHANANTIVKEKMKLARLERLKERRRAENEMLSTVHSRKAKVYLTNLLEDARSMDSPEDIIDVMDQFYDKMDEIYEDEGTEPSEEYISLRDSNSDFYSTWDKYEDETVLVQKDEEESDEDEAYVHSEYGKMEFL